MRTSVQIAYIGYTKGIDGEIIEQFIDLKTKTTFCVEEGKTMWQAICNVRNRFQQPIPFCMD